MAGSPCRVATTEEAVARWRDAEDDLAMAYLPSLGDDPVLLDVFKAFPGTARPLLEYHQVLLRGPSPFSEAERELIAAYVSGLNACQHCHGVHTATAEPSVCRRVCCPICWRMSTLLRWTRRCDRCCVTCAS